MRRQIYSIEDLNPPIVCGPRIGDHDGATLEYLTLVQSPDGKHLMIASTKSGRKIVDLGTLVASAAGYYVFWPYRGRQMIIRRFRNSGGNVDWFETIDLASSAVCEPLRSNLQKALQLALANDPLLAE